MCILCIPCQMMHWPLVKVWCPPKMFSNLVDWTWLVAIRFIIVVNYSAFKSLVCSQNVYKPGRLNLVGGNMVYHRSKLFSIQSARSPSFGVGLFCNQAQLTRYHCPFDTKNFYSLNILCSKYTVYIEWILYTHFKHFNYNWNIKCTIKHFEYN